MLVPTWRKLLFLTLVFLAGCPAPRAQNPSPSPSTAKVLAPTTPQVANIDYVARLNSATTIDIKEYTFSMGKDYDILADGVKVATVSGKDLRLFEGDVFVLKDLNGKVLAYEEEQVEFFQLDRAAVVYDANDNVSGYLGEDRISNLFSLSYIFYFYDANKNEIGKSDKFTNSCLGTHKIYNASGTEAYDVNKHLTLGGDHYTITVTDPKTPINRYKAILLVCIEDAIGDAAAEKD